MRWGARRAAQSGAVAARADGRLPGGSSAVAGVGGHFRLVHSALAGGRLPGGSSEDGVRRKAGESRGRSVWAVREERWLISILYPSSANLSCKAGNPAPRD